MEVTAGDGISRRSDKKFIMRQAKVVPASVSMVSVSHLRTLFPWHSSLFIFDANEEMDNKSNGLLWEYVLQPIL